MSANDSAFPVIPEHREDGVLIRYGEPGVTKREYFAAMAMQGMLSNSIPGSHHHTPRLVKESVATADALLVELEKPVQS